MLTSFFITTLNQAKYALDPPSYETPIKTEKVLVLDSGKLLPPLPSGIPFLALAHDRKHKHDLGKDIQLARGWIRKEIQVSQLITMCNSHEKMTDAKLIHLFQTANQHQFFLYLKLIQDKNPKRKRYELDLTFPPLQEEAYRLHHEHLGLKLFLLPAPNGELTLEKIQRHGRIYKQWNHRLLRIAMCSVSTLMIMRTHFFYCHLLCGMTLFNLATQHLSFEHPILQFMLPHGFQTNHVNIAKGKTLMEQSFTQDFSFTKTGLTSLFTHWMQSYDIRDLSFPQQLARLQGPKSSQKILSPPLLEGSRVHNVVTHYVTAWLKETYPTDELLLHDQELSTFYQAVKELPFRSTFDLALTRHSLILLLSTWLYVHVYLHFEHGDEGENLMQYVTLRIPSTPEEEIEAEVGKQFFYLIFTSVTKKTFLLNRTEWIQALPKNLQPHALDFQRKLFHINPNLELGINK